MSAVACDRWLDHLVANRPIAALGEDPVGVHQVRVASRRLDAWLRLAGRRILRDDLRAVRAACGSARDLDVLSRRLFDEPLAPPGFSAWIADQRASEQVRVRAILSGPRTSGLVRALRVLAPVPRADARARLPALAKQLRRRARVFRERPVRDTERLHGVRRAVRRLRFALEWLGEDAGVLVDLQESFGDLNDTALLAAWVDRYEPPPEAFEAVEAWKLAIRGRISEKIDALTESWDAHDSRLAALEALWISG